MAGLIIFVVFFQLMALANGSEILAPDNFWGFLFWLGVLTLVLPLVILFWPWKRGDKYYSLSSNAPSQSKHLAGGKQVKTSRYICLEILPPASVYILT